MVVNVTAARHYWSNEEALGRCLIVPDTGSKVCRTVIGVVADTARQTLEDDEAIQVYLAQSEGKWPEPEALFIRLNAALTNDALQAVRAELQANLPAGWLVEARPMGALLAPHLRPWRLGAGVFLLFGAIGLLLTIVGLYAAISQVAEVERRAIGIRMALGARRGRLVAGVMKRTLAFVVIGAGAGFVIALAGARYLERLLFGTSPRDPMVYGFVVVGVLAIAALAAYLPARRAARMDPMDLLHSDR